jgi:hypothetical protein
MWIYLIITGANLVNIEVFKQEMKMVFCMSDLACCHFTWGLK